MKQEPFRPGSAEIELFFARDRAPERSGSLAGSRAVPVPPPLDTPPQCRDNRKVDSPKALLVLVLVSAVAVKARAQLAPGQTCTLKKPITVFTKPKGKGRAVELGTGDELRLEQIRGKWMKIKTGGAAVWLKRGKLRNKCASADAVEDPVFEGFGEAAVEPVPEEAPALLVDEGDVEDEPFEEAEPTEPVDDVVESRPDWSGAVDAGGLVGLGAGAQGGETRVTFDLVLDVGWRLLPSLSVGVRLFLHGTPGVGYGFGGATAELRYYLPFSFAGIEPYAGAGIGGGPGAARADTDGEVAAFVAGRITAGGRRFLFDQLFLSGEAVVIVSQLSVAGLFDVGIGWQF